MSGRFSGVIVLKDGNSGETITHTITDDKFQLTNMGYRDYGDDGDD